MVQRGRMPPSLPYTSMDLDAKESKLKLEDSWVPDETEDAEDTKEGVVEGAEVEKEVEEVVVVGVVVVVVVCQVDSSISVE